MIKNAIILFLAISSAALLKVNRDLLSYIREEKSAETVFNIDTEFSLVVSSFLDQKNMQSKMLPQNEVLKQQFSKIEIKLKHVSIMTDPSRDNSISCQKINGKINFSMHVSVELWKTINHQMRTNLVGHALAGCLNKSAVEEKQAIQSEQFI